MLAYSQIRWEHRGKWSEDARSGIGIYRSWCANGKYFDRWLFGSVIKYSWIRKMCTKILLWVLVAKVACVPSYLNSTSCLSNCLITWDPSSFSLTDVQVGANYYAYTESAQTSINRIVYAPVNQTAVTENYSLSSSGPPRLRISSFTNISSQCFLIFTAK